MRGFLDIPLMRISAEGLAIVVSILLAFSIEAWWDEKQDREEEKIVLAALLDELLNVQQTATRNLNSAVAIRASVHQLLTASTGSISLSDEELVVLLEDTAWGNSPAGYNAPVLSSLVSSGDVSIISDMELRLDLAKWAVRLAMVSERVAKDESYLFDITLPFYSSRAWLVPILNAADCKPGDPAICPTLLDQYELPNRSDFSDLLRDQQFQGILVQRLFTVSDMIDFGLDGLADDMNTLIQEIREDLAR